MMFQRPHRTNPSVSFDDGNRWTRALPRSSLAGQLVLVSLLIGACGSAASTSPSATAGLNGQLPQTIRSAGVLTIGSDISFPPMENYANNTPVGFDIDLGNALGKALGLRVSFVNGTFSGLIPALEAGRFDIIMSGMTDTKAREGTVSFLDYLNVGTGILVPTGNPLNIQSLNDLCGRTVAGETGTTGAATAQGQSTTCQNEGKPAVTIDLFPQESSVILALQSGRANAVTLDYTGAVGFAQSVGGGHALTVVANQQGTPSPYGIAVPKNQSQLLTALQAALKQVISSGQYATLLKTWDISSASLTTAQVNGAVS